VSVTTEATIPTALGAGIVKASVDEFSRHGIDVHRLSDSVTRFVYLDCSMELTQALGRLHVRIETPSENLLSFLREEFVERVEEIDPALAQRVRWSGEIAVGERPGNFRILKAVARQEIFPGLVRVTLRGSDVAALNEDGIHVRLLMPLKRGRDPVWPKLGANGRTIWPEAEDALHARFVTIRSLRIDSQEIDVDIAHHSGGLISDWAALQGDDKPVGVIGPGGDAKLPETNGVVLAGDATGLPAIARLIASVGGEVEGMVIGAAPTQAALEDYLPSRRMRVIAIHPEEFDATAAQVALAYGRERRIVYGWFAGEFTTAQSMRTIFKEAFSLDKHSQLSVGYWRKGVPGHASREV